MRLVKLFFPFVILGFFISESALARTFSVERSARIGKRAPALKEIVVDVENTCMSGCRHRVSNVREMRVLERMGPDHFFTWMYIDNVRDSSQFSEVIVDRPSPNAIRVRSTTPSEAKVRELRAHYNLSSSSLFDRVATSWTFQENFNSRGEFVDTSVSYYTEASTSSGILRFFGGRIRGEMGKTADQLMDILRE